MAKDKISKLDNELTELSKLQAERQDRIDPDKFTIDTLAINNSKQQIKALMLELHSKAHDQAGSGGEAVEIFKKKVEEL